MAPDGGLVLDAPNVEWSARAACSPDALGDVRERASTAQAHGFGDLPWHVLRVLMSNVVGHADVDTVRASRLVCRSWRDALSVNITAAILRPLTKQSLDIDDRNRPIINHTLEGLRAPIRCVPGPGLAPHSSSSFQRQLGTKLVLQPPVD